jgi:hypothetical protein
MNRSDTSVFALFLTGFFCSCGTLEFQDGGELDAGAADGGIDLPVLDAGGTGSRPDLDPTDTRHDLTIDAGFDRDRGPGLDVGPDAETDSGGPLVQPTYTVEEAMQDTCITSSVKGLSVQLIEQMNCIEPGVMKSFEGAAGIGYGSYVFPFLQAVATDALLAITASAGTLQLSSALRTLPQQYLLYQWYTRPEKRRECNANLAASPGRSNHNGGLAIDVSNNDDWRTRLRQGDFDDNVSGEPWHFEYTGPGTRDVRSLSVRAFQQMWNRNYVVDEIDEDGIYGPQTEEALKASPAEGFARGPSCTSTRSLRRSSANDPAPEPLRE